MRTTLVPALNISQTSIFYIQLCQLAKMCSLSEITSNHFFSLIFLPVEWICDILKSYENMRYVKTREQEDKYVFLARWRAR